MTKEQILNEVANSDWQPESSKIEKMFHQWLYTVCEIKAGKLKDAHDIFPYIDLTDAKLAFIDGMTEVEYAKQLNN